MFERLDHCPVCGSHSLQNDRIIKDHSISQEEFALTKCRQCEFLFTNPRPTPDRLSGYYESAEYISHQNKSNTLINWIYSIARKFTLSWKFELISKYLKTGKALDIGCGTGHFLAKLKSKGWTVHGVEPDAGARTIAAEQLENDTIVNSLDKINPKNKYDLISLWHVLEHIPDLADYLIRIKLLLNKNGRIFIAVPNHNSFDATHYKNYWAAYDVPRHLYHFNQSSMKTLAQKYGLKIDDIIPMKLDAYYVSLLSEKYKNSSVIKYFNSIITAYKSNSYAKNNKNNYSSLIFVMKVK
ncbi:MAG: class I SAM-dependent methyltransferase [Bacteroidota bacterium]